MVDFFLKKYQWWICWYCLTRWKCQNQQLLPQLNVHVRRPWAAAACHPRAAMVGRWRFCGGGHKKPYASPARGSIPETTQGSFFFPSSPRFSFFFTETKQAIPPPLGALGGGSIDIQFWSAMFVMCIIEWWWLGTLGLWTCGFCWIHWGCNNPCWKCWRKSNISRLIVQKHSLLVPLIWSIEA